MNIQTVFRAGNSNVVAIPKNLMDELDLKSGQKVILEKDPSNEALIIRKATKATKKTKGSVSQEFKKWLKEVMIEDAEILDELATR